MAASATVMGGFAAPTCCAGAPKRMLFGACRGPKDVPLLKKIGFDFWEWNASSAFVPDELDASKWAKRRDEILAAPLPLRSSNGFLPGKFRLTGPQAGAAHPPITAAPAAKPRNSLLFIFSTLLNLQVR